jgi:dTDP-4-dehydrorhamnose reductase
VTTILVVGIDSTVGANIAAHLADKHAVVGLSCGGRIAIENCETALCGASADAPTRHIQSARPDWIIYCGPESRSCWEHGAGERLNAACVDTAAQWAAAARQADCRFTMISSDAAFTGPWIFHDEESLAVCRSTEAAHIRDAEKRVREACPEAMIVRTNAFGWSPAGNGGWVESLLHRIESRRNVDCDCVRHATPILATDLADILDRAWQEGLSGVFHVAGAERVSPLQFAQRLADQFDLPWLNVRREESLTERPEGFGAGETSLQTKKVRKALCVAMPMLSEGLARLHAQQINGFRDRLAPSGARSTAKVA